MEGQVHLNNMLQGSGKSTDLFPGHVKIHSRHFSNRAEYQRQLDGGSRANYHVPRLHTCLYWRTNGIVRKCDLWIRQVTCREPPLSI